MIRKYVMHINLVSMFIIEKQKLKLSLRKIWKELEISIKLLRIKKFKQRSNSVSEFILLKFLILNVEKYSDT